MVSLMWQNWVTSMDWFLQTIQIGRFGWYSKPVIRIVSLLFPYSKLLHYDMTSCFHKPVIPTSIFLLFFEIICITLYLSSLDLMSLLVIDCFDIKKPIWINVKDKSYLTMILNNQIQQTGNIKLCAYYWQLSLIASNRLIVSYILRYKLK